MCFPLFFPFLPCWLRDPSFSSLQISCVSASNELANRQRFRYYFQMLATADQLGPAMFGILKQFQWRKVAIIEQNENVFSLVSCMLWWTHFPEYNSYGIRSQKVEVPQGFYGNFSELVNKFETDNNSMWHHILTCVLMDYEKQLW